MKKDNHLTRNLLILALGLIAVLVSQNEEIATNTILAGTIETIGIALMGYAPIQIALNAKFFFDQARNSRILDQAFRSSVKTVASVSVMPSFFAVDVSGVITPSDRGNIDLRKLQRLRSYANFIQNKSEYPPIVFFTGRSQGYVELLLQSLNMIKMPLDLPHIIENGSALYMASAKKVIPLVSLEQIDLIQDTRMIISKAMPYNEMEPKAYMVTVNTTDIETIGDLRESISRILTDHGLREKLHLSSSSTAVDLTPRDITKLAALEKVLEYQSSESQNRGLGAVTALGDTVSDMDVIRNVGRAYCPSEHVDLEVRNYIMQKFGKNHIISLNDIDFAIKVIEEECGLKIL